MKCGKLKGKSISKTLVMEMLFRKKSLFSSDSVYNVCNLLYFNVKATCREVWRKNYGKLGFNYVRGQVRCTEQHALQGEVAIATT